MKTILLPHDFSAAADDALQYATALAGQLSAQLVLLHATAYPVVSPDMNLLGFSVEELRQDSLTALRKLSSRIRAEHPDVLVQCVVELGDLPGTVAEYCARQPVDLIVMGIQPREQPLLRLLLGHKALGIAREIDKPLLIVPEGLSFRVPQDIVFASDYNPDVEQGALLPQVEDVTGWFNANLHVLHVLPQGHALTPAEAAVDDYIEHALSATPHRTYLVHEHKVASGICDFIEKKCMDLVIAAPKKHALFHRSVTNELVYTSPVPVLVLHPLTR